MATTITVSVDDVTAERAQRYVERHETSIAELVKNILSNLPLEEDLDPDTLPPITRRLYGVAAGGAGEDEYREYLMGKYGA